MKKDSWKAVGMYASMSARWMPAYAGYHGYFYLDPASTDAVIRRARALRARDRKQKRGNP